MKIAIFTNNYLPNPFGVSMSIESFRQELERLGPASTREEGDSSTRGGHTVYVFAPNFKGFVDENKRVFRYSAIDLKFRGVRFPIVIPFSFRLNKVLQNLEIDVVHAQHPNLLGWEAKRWARKKKVPLIFTWHTLYDQYIHFAPAIIPRKLALWWTLRNACNFANAADQVIVPTKSVGEIVRRWGVRNPNLVAVATGVDEQIFKNASRGHLREKYHLQGKKIISLVSRFTKEKNVEFLFDALLPFLQKNPEIIFLIKARGDLEKPLKDRVAQNNLQEQVIFCDEVDCKEDVFAAGDMFVYASKSETQGIILAEACYMGLPIVAINATGACDIIVNGQNGFLVNENTEEFVAAVEKILTDDELRRRMSENAKQAALANWTDKVCTAKLVSIYQQAVAGKRKLES